MRDTFPVMFLLFSLLAIGMFAWGESKELNRHEIELQALQAQVDKKYCEGEVTYPQLKEEFLK